jgi:hypothetical protein
MHFKAGKIIIRLTCLKTTLLIDERNITLSAPTAQNWVCFFWWLQKPSVSQIASTVVSPTEAEVQEVLSVMDSLFHGNDRKGFFPSSQETVNREKTNSGYEVRGRSRMQEPHWYSSE